MTVGPGLYLEELGVGRSAERAHVVAEADLVAFAEVSGDRNPVHLDEAYARATPFEGRIAHGMLSAAYISAVLGTQMPGPGCIYLSQSLRFKRPVRIGDEVHTRAEITAVDPDRARVTMTTTCSVGGRAVLEGEAVVMVPRRPVPAPSELPEPDLFDAAPQPVA